MTPRPSLSWLLVALFSLPALGSDYNVRDYGATGDGRTIDSPAINRAIAAAASAGGGTVRFPAGTYLSFTLRLKSHIELRLDPGCVLVAAEPTAATGGYDAPEPNEWGDRQYQDFGHSHFRNSLIWGDHLEDVTIDGSGRIDGRGLGRGLNARIIAQGPNGTVDAAARGTETGRTARAVLTPPDGSGNKAIALKNCHNVTLRDFSVLKGGWFSLLATGVDNLTIENVKVDTNRDGFDIDACRHVRVADCEVNAPNDDAIVLKSSYALGELRACEDVTITGCEVSGYDAGSFLDGTYRTAEGIAPDRDGPTGRIKIGTESNGRFSAIAISNCVFVRSRGLAIESVDGSVIEDVTVSNLAMREVSNAPIFIRLGNRARGPAGTAVGAIRRVRVSHVVASGVDARYPIEIMGLPGHPIQDLSLEDIRIVYRGGLSLDDAAKQPRALINPFFLRGPGLTGPRDPYAPPEQERAYPEPSMFGLLPAYGIYARHAAGIFARDVSVSFERAETRPVAVLDDVAGARFINLQGERAGDAPFFVLRGVTDFSMRDCPGFADLKRGSAELEIIR